MWSLDKDERLARIEDLLQRMASDVSMLKARSTPGLEARIANLERQQGRQTEGLRRVTEGRYNGAEGSAGIVVELEGGQTTVNAQPDYSPT